MTKEIKEEIILGTISLQEVGKQLHNSLSFVALSNVYLFPWHLPPCYAIHLYKLDK